MLEINMEKPIVFNAKECKECSVTKNRGREIIFVNNEFNCCNLLVFKDVFNFNIHYFFKKDKIRYVQKGEFLYRWINTETGKVTEVTLKEGDSVRQYPGQPHQLKALTDGIIFEVSTEHFDSDSYRIYKEWLDNK